MDAPASATIVDSRLEAAAPCLVCGQEIRAGEGVTARYQGRTLRFKCPGCYARFEANHERYLAGHPAACCPEPRDRPVSEWRCE